jgi:hypothetical protein
MRSCTRLLLGMVVGLIGLQPAMAALIPNAIPGVIGIPYHVGDSGTLNADGNIQRVFNGGGLTVGDVSNPATWTHVSNWNDGWQSNNSTTTGTLVADLGSSFTMLDKLYIWNVTEAGTPLTRGTKTIDIYYATAPTVTPTIGSTTNFASGGWSLLSANVNVTIGVTGGSPYNALVDLTSIPAARYIGFRLIDNYGSTAPARIGLAEVQFTTIPEPTTWTLCGCGIIAMAYCLRRNRAQS